MKQQLDVTIRGMSCGHRVASVRKALQSIEGVEVGDVRVGRLACSMTRAQSHRTT